MDHTHPDEFQALSSSGLRDRFLVTDLFQGENEFSFTIVAYERLLLGGIFVTAGAVALPNLDELDAQFFCENRELAVICLGGGGSVSVDNRNFELEAFDVLYVGRGSQTVAFSGAATEFFLASAPAQATYPTTLTRAMDVEAVDTGETAKSNVRTIRKYIHPDGTAIVPTHPRYHHPSPGQRLEHDAVPHAPAPYRGLSVLRPGTGRACRSPVRQARRDTLVADKETVVSPPWSVHTGAGTSAYSFVWLMAGENRTFADMQHVDMERLR